MGGRGIRDTEVLYIQQWLEVVSLVQDPFTNVRTGEPTYLGGEWRYRLIAVVQT